MEQMAFTPLTNTAEAIDPPGPEHTATKLNAN
jgi:hypothetical protein